MAEKKKRRKLTSEDYENTRSKRYGITARGGSKYWTKKSLENAKPKTRIQRAREEIQHLAEIANARAEGLDGRSAAMRKAKKSLPSSRLTKSGKVEGDLFTGNLWTRKELMNELARIQEFLGDWRSTKEGEAYYAMEEDYYTGETAELYRGQFGGQWLSKTGETFNTKYINKDFAMDAFDLYRRLVEESGGEERAKLLWSTTKRANYDSESMIIELYDMLSQGYDEASVMDYARLKMRKNYFEWASRQWGEDQPGDYERLEKDFEPGPLRRR